MSIDGQSYVRNVLLDVFFKFCATRSVGSEDDPALEGNDDLWFRGGMQFRQVQSFQFFLVNHYDVHSLLELIDDAGLQIFVEGDQCFAWAAPCGMDVDDEQFWIFVGVVREEVFGVANGGGQFDLLSFLGHLSYIICTRKQRFKLSNTQNTPFQQSPTNKPKNYNYMINLKYFAFCKSSASLPVLGVTLDKSLEQSLKVQIPRVVAKLKELQLKKQQRQRIKTDFGVWSCKKDQNGMYYLALTLPNYPERHIFAAFSQIQAHLATIGDYENQPDATLKLHAKEKMNQIAQKYNNLNSIDKIGEANRVLDGVSIKQDIADSTLKLMNNTVNLQGLQRKASDLKQNALMFEQSATEVEREMWCKNCKMKILIGVVIVGLICVIVIPIATSVGKK